MKTLAVLGNGPAGLFAAWAGIEAGLRVTVLSATAWNKPQGESAGVYVLHSAMGLPLRRGEMRNIGFGGTAQDYAQKVYGDSSVGTSFPAEESRDFIWDGSQAIDLAWDIIQTTAQNVVRRFDALYEIHDLASHHDYVVSTVPLDAVSAQGVHIWRPAWVKTSEAPAHDAFSMYNAHPDAQWYRASAMFGRFTMEFSSKPTGHSVQVRKVVDGPRAVSLRSNLIFAGRFGTWDKRELSDAAYYKTKELIGG